jgi:KDO2-lipid IV(A) lauroyltransferase
MQDILKRIVSALLTVYGAYIGKMSWDRVRRSGARIGRLMARLDPRRFAITIENLRQAFPEKEERELKSIAIQSYENLGITMAELLKSRSVSDTELLSRVQYNNPHMIQRLHGKGQGLILLSGHYGNWEFLAITAGLIQDEQVNVVVKYQQNNYVNQRLLKLREKWGNKLIDMGNAARSIMSVVKENGILAMLVDQRASEDKDIYVDFFGRKAATYEAPASLSIKYDIPIVMGFANRLPDGRYKVDLIELDRTGMDKAANPIEELTKRHVRLLEKEIRKNPGMWAWQHDRWKFTKD